MSRPTSAADLRSRLSTFHDRFRDRPPVLTEPVQSRSPRPAPDTGDPIPPPSRGSQEARNLLPYPAAVYRAAADLLREHQANPAARPPLTICIAPGPHVPGVGCPTVHVAELLQQIAEALEPQS